MKVSLLFPCLCRPLLEESGLSSSRAQTDTPVGVSGFTPAPRQQFTENNQLSSEKCTPERGLLIPFAREPNWRTLVALKKGGFTRGHVGGLRRCTHTLAENPNVTPRNSKSHFCTCIRAHIEPRARPTCTVLCSLQCHRRPSCEIHVSRPRLKPLVYFQRRLVLPPGLTQSYFHTMLQQWKSCPVCYWSVCGITCFTPKKKGIFQNVTRWFDCYNSIQLILKYQVSMYCPTIGNLQSIFGIGLLSGETTRSDIIRKWLFHLSWIWY